MHVILCWLMRDKGKTVDVSGQENFSLKKNEEEKEEKEIKENMRFIYFLPYFGYCPKKTKNMKLL